VTVERRTVDSLFEPPGYAHVAIASGRAVFTAGAVPLNDAGQLVGEGVREQTRQVIENLLAQLAAGGAQPDDVVKTTVYVAADERAMLTEAWDVVRTSALAGAPSTLLGVAALGYDGQLVEIEAVAVVD
jgi:enamine deaminase RidA (YjgF/YER057c/UK114 family)